MKMLEKEWLDFRNAVIPKNAPSVQIIESRRAFYAGAWSFYHLLMDNLEPGKDATSRDLTLMAALDAEMRDFQQQMARGLV